MTSLRTFLVLSLLASARAAPAGHQVAGQSHQEAADSALRQTDAVPIETGDPDVSVSVATSTSMEITTVMSSVSSEMRPLPASPGVAEAEKAAGDVTPPPADVTLNEIEDAGATEAAKAAEAEERAPTADAASSVSTQMPEAKETVSVTKEEDADGADAAEPVPGGAADAAASEEGSGQGTEDESQTAEGSGQGAEVETRTEADPEDGAEVEGSGAAADAETSNTTKGTLIFDLGEGATAELHDLVQQTVLEALMEEGLLAAADDLTPAIQAEGSGIVFSDGSGEGEDLTSTSPFVSIHF